MAMIQKLLLYNNMMVMFTYSLEKKILQHSSKVGISNFSKNYLQLNLKCNFTLQTLNILKILNKFY